MRDFANIGRPIVKKPLITHVKDIVQPVFLNTRFPNLWFYVVMASNLTITILNKFNVFWGLTLVLAVLHILLSHPFLQKLLSKNNGSNNIPSQ